MSRIRFAVLSMAALALLGGCGVFGHEGGQERFEVGETTTHLRVEVTPVTITSEYLGVDYVIENTTEETLWVVEEMVPAVVEDVEGDTYALASVVLPVDDEVAYATPPASQLTEVAPGQTLQGAYAMTRPFRLTRQFHDDEPRDVEMSSTRLCFGHLPASTVDELRRLDETPEPGRAQVLAEQAFPMQQVSCSTPFDLAG